MRNFKNQFFYLGVFILLFAGCAQSGSSSKIKIGCAAPLTGDQAQIGNDTCQGVKLAIQQANEKGDIIPGYQLEYNGLDDQHNPSQAVNVAKKLVADPDVVAVVGHFNSSCTKPASAIYHEAKMVQITAGSTNPELSKQGFETFFRVSATDDVQGPKGAQFAAKNLNVKKVFIIDDKTTYGKGLADQFEKEAQKLGVTVLGHEGITQGDKDFSPLITKIKPLEPELIYFGGIYPEAALLLRQARAVGLQIPLLGGDGIANPVFIELATPSIAEGAYATMVGGDMTQLPTAQKFVEAYRSAFGMDPQWGAYSFDATNILIEAIKKAGTKDRQAILKAVREMPSFQGITGEVVFDKNGDNKNQFIGIFKVENGKLAYVGPAE